jgi:hypothetical protein
MLDSPVMYCIISYFPLSLIHGPVKCREWKHYHTEPCILQKFRVQFSPAEQLKFIS